MSECFGENFIKNGCIYGGEDFVDDHIMRGKSIYEVIRVIDGVPLFLERHLERLKASTALTNNIMILDSVEIKNNINRLIKHENRTNGNIKIVFNYHTSGETYYLYFLKHSYPSDEQYSKGVHTILYHGERENPNAKVINLNFREKVEGYIKNNSAYEAILVDNRGYITEGSKSNIFMVYDNCVITSPIEAVLPGVTRNVIISLLKRSNIAFREEKFCYEDIDKLQALFISGTSPKVLPIKSVDNKAFASSQNDLVIKIMELYNHEVYNYTLKSKA